MASPSTLPILLDLDASPVQGQMGWAVMDLQGRVLRNVGLSQQHTSLLFQILQESTPLVNNNNKNNDTKDGLQKLTISFSETKFLITRDETHVYLVQTRAR